MSNTKRWLFIVLWSMVGSIVIAVVVSLINIRAVNPLTYITGLVYIAIPALFVYLLQRWITRKNHDEKS